MSNQNSIPVFNSWKSWYVLTIFAGVFATTAAIAVSYVNAGSEVTGNGINQQSGQQASTTAISDKRYTDLAQQVTAIETRLATIDNDAIITSEKLRSIDSIERQLTDIHTTLGAYQENLNNLAASTKQLTLSILEADRKITGTEFYSEHLNRQLLETGDQLNRISIELNNNTNQLNQAVAAIRLGFAQNPDVQPLLDLLTLNSLQDPDLIIKALTGFRTGYRHEPQTSGQPHNKTGISNANTQILADVYQPQSGSETISSTPAVETAEPAQLSREAGQAKPAGQPLRSDGTGDNRNHNFIIKECKNNQDRFSADNCGEYFTDRLPPTLE